MRNMKNIFIFSFVYICTLVLPGEALAKEVSESHLYQISQEIISEMTLLHISTETEHKSHGVNLKAQLPRHAYQKSLELLMKVQMLKENIGLPVSYNNVFSASKPVSTEKILGVLKQILEEIRSLRSHYGVKKSFDPVGFEEGKTIGDVYEDLFEASIMVDELARDQLLTSRESYQLARVIIKELHDIRQAKNIDSKVREIRLARNKDEFDVYTHAEDLILKLKRLSDKEGFAVPGGIRQPNIKSGTVTQSDVFDVLNRVVAEVNALKLATGIQTETSLETLKYPKTSAEVYNAVSEARALINSMLFYKPKKQEDK